MQSPHHLAKAVVLGNRGSRTWHLVRWGRRRQTLRGRAVGGLCGLDRIQKLRPEKKRRLPLISWALLRGSHFPSTQKELGLAETTLLFPSLPSAPQSHYFYIKLEIYHYNRAAVTWVC